MSAKNHKVGALVEGIRVPEEHSEIIDTVVEGISDIELRKDVVHMLAKYLGGIETDKSRDGESYSKGLFNVDSSNFNVRFQPDYDMIGKISEALKALNHKIVLTSGTFDIIHIGHADYLEEASKRGDFMIVGVDSNEKVKRSKGDSRPLVDEVERMSMLAHLRCVDLITLKDYQDPKWHLIKTVQPDTLVATEGTYTEAEVEHLHEAGVGRVVVLPPQATTSTTARLRKAQISWGMELLDVYAHDLAEVVGLEPAQADLAIEALKKHMEI